MALSQALETEWEEDSLLRLYLTTLAGTVIQLQVPLSIHHHVGYAGRVPGRAPTPSQPH